MNPASTTTLLAMAVVSAHAAPMVYRMVKPIPPEDLAILERFVANRDEKLVAIRKMWIGGPGRSAGRAFYVQTGRLYRIVAQSSDGSHWTHVLAVDGTDVLGNRQLKQHLNGVWSPVIQ